MVSGGSNGARALDAEVLPGLLSSFAAAFGAGEPPRVFFSPGRVNLMGAHLDYNGGPVMPTAIDRGTFVALRPRAGRTLRLASMLAPEVLEVELDRLPIAPGGTWVDYPIGVVVELARRAGRDDLSGVDVLFGGNLAVGAGLSSSASICVGTAYALDLVWELGLSDLERVHCALEAEREFVGVHCGIMDPYAVGLARPGHLLWLDCKDASSEHLRFGDDLCLAVADTRVRRELAQSEFNRRVAECGQAFELLRPHQEGATCLRDVARATLDEHGERLPSVLRRRAEHVVQEVERTFAARAALLRGDAARFGQLMFEAHASLRDLYEVSCPELDRLVEDARSCEGVLGSRLTGAGFGGCAVVVLRRGREEDLRAHLLEGFLASFGVEPDVRVYGGDEGPRELET